VGEFMKRVVAYSYSASFELGNERPNYTMPFFKTEEDQGEIRCHAYGDLQLKNKIFVIFNDKPDLIPRDLFSDAPDRIWTRHLRSRGNKDLYALDRTSFDPNMTIRFTLDDQPKKLTAKDRLTVACTILIIGPALAPPNMLE
jgi:hypothetical protein